MNFPQLVNKFPLKKFAKRVLKSDMACPLCGKSVPLQTNVNGIVYHNCLNLLDNGCKCSKQEKYGRLHSIELILQNNADGIEEELKNHFGEKLYYEHFNRGEERATEEHDEFDSIDESEQSEPIVDYQSETITEAGTRVERDPAPGAGLFFE